MIWMLNIVTFLALAIGYTADKQGNHWLTPLLMFLIYLFVLIKTV